MDLNEWPEPELCALARVYIRRKKAHKAGPLREELQRRLAEEEKPKLRALHDQLAPKNSNSIALRVIGLFRHAS